MGAGKALRHVLSIFLGVFALSVSAGEITVLRFEQGDYGFKNPVRLDFQLGEEGILFSKMRKSYPLLYSAKKFAAHIEQVRNGGSWILSGVSSQIAYNMEQHGPGTRINDYCSDVLAPLESLPIRIMERRGILSKGRAERILASGNHLSPENISFVMDASVSRLDLTEGDLKGAVKVISGQSVEGGITPLPLEYREEVDVTKEGMDAFFDFLLDRKRYPFAWELGRFTAESKPALRNVLTAALGVMKRELALAGGKMSEAYVFGHAITGIHSRLYRNDYGMKVVKMLNEATGESVMAVPLSELLALYPQAMIESDLIDVVRNRLRKIVLNSADGSLREAIEMRLSYPTDAAEVAEKVGADGVSRLSLEERKGGTLQLDFKWVPTQEEFANILEAARRWNPEFKSVIVRVSTQNTKRSTHETLEGTLKLVEEGGNAPAPEYFHMASYLNKVNRKSLGLRNIPYYRIYKAHVSEFKRISSGSLPQIESDFGTFGADLGW